MITEPLPFFSSGLRLDADLHLPDDDGAGAPYPVIVPASGYQGLKVIHPQRFARALAPLGYAVLAFDYRGFGQSEGERGRLVPQEWVEDVRAAVDRITTVPHLSAERVGLLGWGLGGGVVVSEAADDPRIRAVASVNGIGDGARSARAMHDDMSWRRLVERVTADRGRRATTGRSEVTSPWDVVRLDRDAQTDGYVGEELYKAPGFGYGVTLESADLLLRFRPEAAVAKVAPRPLLIVHGTENRLHRPEESRSLYHNAGEPKELVLLPGVGHTEWMHDGHPTFEHLVGVLHGFFGAALGASRAAPMVGAGRPERR